MNVLFLIEAGGRFGLGHLMRCMALVNVLRARGHAATIAVRLGGEELSSWLTPDAKRIWLNGKSDVDVSAHAEALAAEQRPDWAVVDGYDMLAAGVVTRLQVQGLRVLAFDDLATTGGGADLVVNPNACADVSARTSPSLMLGPAYAPIDPAYRACRARSVGEKMNRVLITFGGSDLHGMTRRVIAACSALPDTLVLDVVVGPALRLEAAALPASQRVTVHERPNGISALLAKASVAITAAGSTCWQICCVGVPMIAVQTVDNQREVVRRLEASGSALTFNRSDFVTLLEAGGLPDLIRKFDPAAVRNEMVAAQNALVDGNGASRIVEALEG